MQYNKRPFKYDFLTIILFFVLVGFGWVNILSASSNGNIDSIFNLSLPYGKQLLFIALTLLLISGILALESKFYERFSSIIYIISMLSLVGLFIFGKNVNGALSWYAIGGITIQPSEFAKFATALAISKHLSDIQTSIGTFKDQLIAVLLILIPSLLILLQYDTGSTLVYASFLFVFFREGLQKIYLIVGFSLLILSILTLKYGIVITSLTSFSIILCIYFLTINKRPKTLVLTGSFVLSTLIAFSVKFFYSDILKPHQQDRISIWLRLEKNPEIVNSMKRDIAYNLNESEKAISSGDLLGRGFMQGTRTTGKFVPEQHTDYIFSTVGEEWGFIGSALTVIMFCALLLRIIYLSELQKNQFSRVYGYSVASILFTHFTINIGMVMGLIPTIGIPLPFFSYGGSGLWAFTILLFVFIKLDANKVNEW